MYVLYIYDMSQSYLFVFLSLSPPFPSIWNNLALLAVAELEQPAPLNAVTYSSVTLQGCTHNGLVLTCMPIMLHMDPQLYEVMF